MQPHRREMALHCPDIAARDRSRQGTGDTEGASVGQGLLGEAPVDGQGSLLVKPGDRSQLDDRIEEGNEAARREHRRRVIGRL